MIIIIGKGGLFVMKKKIVCILLACVLCVTALGGCNLRFRISELQSPAEGMKLLNNLDDFPEIREKKEILFHAVDTELGKNGFTMTNVEYLIAYIDADPSISVYYSSGENGNKDFVFTLVVDIVDAKIIDLSVNCKKTILNEYPKLFSSVCRAILCSSVFTFSESEIDNFLAEKESMDLQAYELTIQENEEYIWMSLEDNLNFYQ